MDDEAHDARTATFRLNEGVSHSSRAEDLDDLHRLQKSSTKPREGMHCTKMLSKLFCLGCLGCSALLCAVV